MTLGADFRRLWTAYGVSEFGSAVGSGALPLIAILVLDASDLQVSLLAALAGVAAAAIALPLGPWIEFRRKRPVMIGADLVRFGALASVPVAAAAGVLSYVQLCLVAVTQTAGAIVFTAASGAHLKALVEPESRAEANGRFESTVWAAISVGPPLGGALISWLGATVTVGVDAVSFLLSALGIRRLRASEPPPPARTAGHNRRRELADGWRYLLSHPSLRALYWNSLVFGGCIMASVPLLAVLMLRDLGFSSVQYGLALGLPCLGGVAGSMLAKGLVRRTGQRGVLLAFGLARTLWLGLLPLAPAGGDGLVVIIVAETLLLLCAGIFNPTFATYRMQVTEDAYMARVFSAWSVSSRGVQPIFIAVSGLLATAVGVRSTLTVLAVVLLSSAAFLPWRTPVRGRPVGEIDAADRPTRPPALDKSALRRAN
jgi:predicted MFS family arabinose efflux permease